MLIDFSEVKTALREAIAGYLLERVLPFLYGYGVTTVAADHGHDQAGQ